MNLDLRQAIMQRVQNKSKDELVEIIESSIGSDEKSLPGLGVLFEIMWQHTNDQTRQTLVKSLYDQISSVHQV